MNIKKTIGLSLIAFALANAVQAFEVLPPQFGDHHDGSHPAAAPEIDPAAAFSALALLAGSVAVIRARRKR